MITTCKWADLIIWMEMSSCEFKMCGIDMIWMWRWTDYLWEKILKDGQRSLRSSKAIFDQGGSYGVE